MAIYERSMTISYECDIVNTPKVHNQVKRDLHENGVSIQHHYGTVPEDTAFGLQEVVSKKESYDILVNDKLLCTVQYRFQSRDMVDELTKNGWDAISRKNETISTVEEVIAPKGKNVVLHFDSVEGTMQPYSHTSMYNNGVELKVTLENYGTVWALVFKITYDTYSNLMPRKDIKKALVDTPLHDMQVTQKIVSSFLGVYSESLLETTVDCITFIRTNTEAKCDPLTISKVLGTATEESPMTGRDVINMILPTEEEE